LRVRDRDVRIHKKTGLLATDRGVSVRDRPDGLEHFGGAFRVTNLPPELHIVQVGRDPHHFEIAPARPMTRVEYEDALARITLVPV
jgi:hypothetical protein